MVLKSYVIEHCHSGCPKTIRQWDPLIEEMRSDLEKLNLEEKLKQKFPKVLYHHLPKIGLSGCPNGCSQPQIKDLGLLGYVSPRFSAELCLGCQICVKVCVEHALAWGTESISIDPLRCLSCGDCIRSCSSGALSPGETGWRLVQGGRVGRHPRFAHSAGKVTTDEEAKAWILTTLEQYFAESCQEERLTNFIERVY
ncbi:MAG: 4Fe-4S dicluster domain-containing protein [Desulfitobacteriaceae bacterium]